MSQGVYSPEQQVRMIITKVVSVTFDRCQTIILQLSVGPAATFRQEPDNAQDSNAIRVECSDGEAYHWAGECEIPTAKARWLPGSSSAAIHRWFGGRLAETCLSNGITRRHSALYQT